MIQTSLLKKKKHPQGDFTFIDLFAGIGGTRLGFESVGGRCVFSSEWDKYSQRTYAENFGETPHGDITKIRSETIPDFDVLLAGFPCQPFSSIGKRQGFLHATQGTLFYEVARIIKDKRPKSFMLENVQGLLTHDNGKTFSTILDVLDELDYEVQYQVLNAADYGVPQMRKRIYIVGFDRKCLGDDASFNFPKKIVKKHADIGDFIVDEPTGKYAISEHLQKSYLFKKDDGRPVVVDIHTKGAAKTLVASYHKIQRLTGTFVKGGATGMRLFTEGECKSLMGFPQDFIIPVSRTQMYRQFGNSIVVPVVAAIADAMKPSIIKAVHGEGVIDEQQHAIAANRSHAYGSL